MLVDIVKMTLHVTLGVVFFLTWSFIPKEYFG